jgi:hypothetical protein
VADLKMKTDSFGGCYAEWMVPSSEQINPDTKIVSFMFTFDNALRLKAMLDDAVLWLNRINRTDAESKRAALKLNVRLKDGRFYAMRGQLPDQGSRLFRQSPEAEEEQ